MTIKPLADRVVLKMVEADETTKSGIILTGSLRKNRRLPRLSRSGRRNVDGRRLRCM